MKIELPKDSKYIVAVSGGVDSMVLLHLLNEAKTKNNWELVVAHLDHGIRSDSKLDLELVRQTAESMDIPFVSSLANLGPNTSEEQARIVRYSFLNQILKDYQAQAIVTAHHEDDQIETAILNIIRGTGRKGLTSLSSEVIQRPLIHYPKSELIKYALVSNIVWREDSTNADTNYLRNYIRHNIVPKLKPTARSQLLHIINKTTNTNKDLDALLINMLKGQSKPNQIDRQWFNLLSHESSKEVLATWFRMNGINSFNRNTLERLSVKAKTAKTNAKLAVLGNQYIKVNKDTLALVSIER